MYSRQAQVVGTGEQRTIRTTARGYEVLRDPALNKGTAFTADERSALGLNGLLPPVITTELEPQLDRAYAAYQAAPTNLDKHIYMWRLHDNNVTLFYALLGRHLLEMLPIVYDPVVGEAIEKYSEVMTRPRGVFLSIDDPDGVEGCLAALGASADDIDLIVDSDAEEILGIGDWGANGIDISIGKLAVYTAAAGVDPYRVIPMILDAGTDNQKLLNDPLYIGYRHGRIRGQQYDDFIDAYVQAAKKLFPKAMLHWEDFGSTNARRIRNRYRDQVPTFNDNMQGTGAIVMSGLFNAVKVAGTAWRDQRVVIFGGGTAGCGIADQIRDQIARDGLSVDEATRRIWIVDLPGLLTSDMSDGMLDYQRPYARPVDEVAGRTRYRRRAAVAGDGHAARAGRRTQRNHRPRDSRRGGQADDPDRHSTTPGMFTEQIVKSMAAHNERPIIFPLSNPTELHEATPAHLLEWTDGKALIGTGAPWDDVEHGGVTYRIGQANNAALYPGLGLGVIVARASQVTDEMILVAAQAVAAEADLTTPGASLPPSNAALRTTSSIVAAAVARTAAEQGIAQANVSEPVEAVRETVWWSVYVPVEAA